MKILAFDTSNQVLTVAVLEGNYLLGDLTLAIKKNHSISLMPSIDFLMNSLDLTPQDLGRIVVAEGPGSYTGLRVAVATAKTLSYSLGIDLVGVSSLAVLAASSGAQGLVVPLMDARRNNVYAGFYDNGRALRPDQHQPLASVLADLKAYEQVTLVGEVEAFREQIVAELPQAIVQSVNPSAVALGRLGADLSPVSIHDFAPAYLKRVEAEENWLKTNSESNQDYVRRV